MWCGLLCTLYRFEVVCRIYPLGADGYRGSYELSTLLLPVYDHTKPMRLPYIIRCVRPITRPCSVFTRVPRRKRRPPRITRQTSSLLHSALFSLLPPRYRCGPLFLCTYTMMRHIYGLGTFSPKVKPNMATMLFHGRGVLPPVTSHPHFISVSRTLWCGEFGRGVISGLNVYTLSFPFLDRFLTSRFVPFIYCLEVDFRTPRGVPSPLL